PLPAGARTSSGVAAADWRYKTRPNGGRLRSGHRCAPRAAPIAGLQSKSRRRDGEHARRAAARHEGSVVAELRLQHVLNDDPDFARPTTARLNHAPVAFTT